MASTVVFHSTHHTVSRCTTPTKLPVYEPLCLPDYVPRSAPSVEHIFSKNDNVPYYSPPPLVLDAPTKRPATANSASTTTKSPPARSPSKANHAKLHKKRYPNPPTNYTTSRPRPKRRVDASSDSPALTSLAENSSFEVPYVPPPPSSRSPTRERLKNNLLRFSTYKDEDMSLDMSLTAEENAGRLGLAICSSCPTSPLMGGGGDGGRSNASSTFRVHYHGRSRSNGSQVSLNSSLFKPTTPFSFKMPPPAQPYTPSRLDSYNDDNNNNKHSDINNSNISSEEAENIIRAMEESRTRPILPHADVSQGQVSSSSEESEQSSLQASQSSTPTPLSEAPSLPPGSLSKATTLGSRSCLSSSNSDLHSRCRGLSRRSTEMSEIGSPRSTSSFSFRPKIKEENIDPVQRAATIAAARRAFAEREEEKTRKHEDRQRKAAEKQRRKQQASPRSSRSQSLEQQQQQHSSLSLSPSSAASSPSPSRKTSLDDADDAFYGREYSELTPVSSNALPTKIQTINLDAIRRPKANKSKNKTSNKKSSLNSSLSSSSTKKKNKQKQSNGNRRSAKGIYVRSFLWLKMRMLNLARKNKKTT